MTSDRLYYTDPYLVSFTAILAGKDSTHGVLLDQTAFYPTSGGQPHDLGKLNGIPVLSVDETEDGRIVHVLAQPLNAEPGAPVTGEIDGARRFDHMQQHTGQHLLSAVCFDLFGFETVSFHMGADVSTIELATPVLSAQQIDTIEQRTNAEIAASRPVTIAFEDAASVTGLRKASGRTGILRIVTINGLDRSACGGTHVRSTGEIGCIQIRGSEKIRGNTRIEFVCGLRATLRARADYRLLTTIASHLGSAVDDTASLVATQAARLADADKTRRKLSMELAQYKGRDLYTQTTPDERTGLRVHTAEYESFTDESRVEAQAFTAGPKSVCLAIVRGSKPAVLLAASADAGIHAGDVLKPIFQEFVGRGGGSAQLAQGSFPDELKLDSAIDRIRTALLAAT